MVAKIVQHYFLNVFMKTTFNIFLRVNFQLKKCLYFLIDYPIKNA